MGILGSSMQISGGGGGSGDMLKSTYDTNDDGVVDAAATSLAVTDSVSAPTGRTAQLFVAASNATAIEIAQADYVCDGTADQAQINSALATLTSGQGGIVKLSSGDFNLSDRISMNGNVYLIGSGKNSTQLNSGVVDYMIAIQNSDNKVASIRFNVNYSAGITDSGIFMYNATNTIIEDCYIYDIYKYGIRNQLSVNTVVRDCVVIGNNRSEEEYGYCGYSDSTLQKVISSKFVACGWNGIITESDIIIQNCTLDNCAGGNGGGQICIEDADYALIEGNVLLAATTASQGIECGQYGGSIQIINNFITDQKYNGIRVYTIAGTKSLIMGNTIKNTRSGAGIYLGYVSSAGYHSIIGNRCYDDQGTKTQTYGLQITANIDNVICTGNDFSNNKDGYVTNGSSGSNIKFLNNVGYDVNNLSSATIANLTSGQIPVAGTGGLLGNGPAYSSSTITASTAWTKALGSDHTWSGAVSTLTAGTSLVLGDLCYIGSDGKMEKAQGDAATHVPVVAFCTGTIAEDATGVFLMQGFVRDDSWNWTPGALLYIDDDTAGLITATLPADTGDQDQIVGIAVTADIIYFNPNYMVIEHA